MTTPLPADRVVAGRWRLDTVLGEGATGRTWLAHRVDPATDGATAGRDAPERVAIKELLPHRMRGWKNLELFEREARLLESLSHPGIPMFHEHISELDGDPPRAFLVQELIEGPTLLARLTARPLTGDEVRHLARQLLEVLVYLHGMTPPVLHRDIKPANVMFRKNGHAVLIDFGAVREVLRDADHRGSTMVGTIGYMPPEQYGGRALPASDLFSTGATLVHALTGKPPDVHFDGQFAIRLPEDLGVSAGLRGLLETLLAVDPADRPASAREALRLLDGALLDGVPERRLAALPPDPGNAPRSMRLFRNPQDGRLVHRGVLLWTLVGSFGLALIALGGMAHGPLIGPGIAWTLVAGFEWVGRWRNIRPLLRRLTHHELALGELQGITRYPDLTTISGEEALCLHYRFQHRGRLYRGTFASFAPAVDDFEPGDPIRVLFDPDNPGDNMPYFG